LLSKNADDQTKVVFWTENKHYTHIVHQEAAKIIGKNI